MEKKLISQQRTQHPIYWHMEIVGYQLGPLINTYDDGTCEQIEGPIIRWVDGMAVGSEIK